MEKELLEKIEFLKGKNVRINIKGFLEMGFNIRNLLYSCDKDILKLKDELKEAYITININQIYKIQNRENKISLSLDNDTMVELFIYTD